MQCSNYLTQYNCTESIEIENCVWCASESTSVCIEYNWCNDKYINNGSYVVCNNAIFSQNQSGCDTTFEMYLVVLSLMLLVLALTIICLCIGYQRVWKRYIKIGLWIFLIITLLDTLISAVYAIIGYLDYDVGYAMVAIEIVEWYILVFMVLGIIGMIIFIPMALFGVVCKV